MQTLNAQSEMLRIVTLGSVDDGKSTLIGRLLKDTDSIYEDQWEALEKQAAKKGTDVDLSLLTDGLAAEREQGITIDVAYRSLNTPKRRLLMADVPGHVQYTRNMVTGASNAEAALLLVDAALGISEQLKRHLFIATLLGIPHILVVVNKMDLVNYSEEVFENIKNDIVNFSARLKMKDLQFIPVSSLKGNMVVERGEQMNWYTGRTLLDYLENIETTSDRNLIDFRFPVQLVLRDHRNVRGYAGMVESGVIKKGEEITVWPSGRNTRIRSILMDGVEKAYAFNPQSIVLTLEDEIDVSRGDVLARPNNIPQTSNQFEAMLCWLDQETFNPEKSYLLKHTTKITRGRVTTLSYKIDINTLHRVESKTLDLNDIGRVHIQTTEPLCFDPYENNRNTGSFVLIDESTHRTVAAGMILQTIKKEPTDSTTSQKSAPVLWFTGLSGSGKSTIADKVAERLTREGKRHERLDGDVLRESLTQSLGFSKEDREKNIEIAGFLTKRLSTHGIMVIATFISPYRAQRETLRGKMDSFVEIFINTPLELCEERDPKGLYKKARNGEISSFTGIDSPYEAPENPELEIRTDTCSADEAAEQIVEFLKNKGHL